MLTLLLPLILFYVANGRRGTCAGWKNETCVRALKEYYNYTVEDVDLKMRYLHALITEERVACKLAGECPIPTKSIIGARTPCVNGKAGIYDCNNIDMLAFVSLSDLGSNSNADGNDIWGWTDAAGSRYAITGQTDGSSIVDITDAENPEVLCFIPSQVSTSTIWRDMKVSASGFAYIVADRSGQGLQYLNLADAIASCRASSSRPLRVTPSWTSAIHTGSTNTHNIALNVASNTGYLVGSGSCSGGLLMFNTPSGGVPTYAGCFSSDGYTHDTECIMYSGPDTRYTGREICFGYNENSITIVDVSNKGSPQMLSRMTYSGSAYTHQGWITEDHRYLLMNDELDEQRGTVPSQTTYIVDVQSLTNPTLINRWYSGVNVIDHNLYIKGNFVYEANYRAGLRVLDLNNVAQGQLNLQGFFNTWTGASGNSFDGAWSNYPYYAGAPNVVVVQDINRGLFILDVSNAVSES